MRTAFKYRNAHILWILLVLVRFNSYGIQCYKHSKCTREMRAQFQLADCSLPAMNSDLLLSEASFLCSHNAATGYIQPTERTKTGISWFYSKNQVGSVFDQLQHGARALDLRPFLLLNGTIIMHHGDIHISVSLNTVVQDSIRFCSENPGELVVLLLSHYGYQTTTTSNLRSDDAAGTGSMISSVADVLGELNVNYFDCSDVYGLTVAEAMAATALASGGSLLVLASEDGSVCAKENWIESQLVTCYPNSTITCRSSDGPWRDLQKYMLASSNDEASYSNLGPSNDLYKHPFFENQALWQVTTASAVSGLAHFSSIIQDNARSAINQKVMQMAYESQFSKISLLVVDNVALNGNALTSVLRTACGQSVDSDTCGPALPLPRLRYAHLSALHGLLLCVLLYSFWFVYSVVYHKRPKRLHTAVSRILSRGDTTDSRSQNLVDEDHCGGAVIS